MPRNETFGENLYIRVPRGIRAEVEALRANERQADFLRRLLLKALAEERMARDGNAGTRGCTDGADQPASCPPGL
jgi:hypothetical protein